MNDIENNFIEEFNKRDGFWYVFKRTTAELDKIFTHFNIFKDFENKSWFENQSNFVNILTQSKLLTLHSEGKETKANARGYKKIFEQLGFCYEDSKGLIKITPIGRRFYNATNEEFENIKTEQLIKYQIYNPFIDSKNFENLRLKPYIYLLKLLLIIDENYITLEEFKLFVFRSYNSNQLDDCYRNIKWWRGLSNNEKEAVLIKIKKIHKSTRGTFLLDKLAGYANYSANFFGVSYFTSFNELNNEKIIFLKKNKIKKLEIFLSYVGVDIFQKFLNKEDYISFYGNSTNILNSLLKDEEDHLSKRIELIFDLDIRAINCLKSKNIISLSDLLNEKNLKEIPNLGDKTFNRIIDELKNFNKLNNTNFKLKDKDNYYYQNNITEYLDFEKLNKNLQYKLFLPIEYFIKETRAVNHLKSLSISNYGDLYNNKDNAIYDAKEHPNIGIKTLNNLIKFFSDFTNNDFPKNGHINNWNEIKEKYHKYTKKSKSLYATINYDEVNQLEYLDDEIIQFNNVIKFNRFDIIIDLYGLDGTGTKTLELTGNKFKLTRERVRQIEKKFLEKLKLINIKSKKIENLYNLLNDLIPIKTNEFENLLKEKKIVKNILTSDTLLSLINLFYKKDDFDITKYYQYSIIQKKDDKKIKNIISFISKKINSFSFINLDFICKEFEVKKNNILSIVKIDKDYDVIDDNWIYLKNKNGNYLYNALTKIFNVTNKINKFQLEKALEKARGLKHDIKFDVIKKYCEKVFNAFTNENEIIVDQNQIDKYVFNTSKSILSDNEKHIIKIFKDKKLKNYFELENDLVKVGISLGTVGFLINWVTPIILKLAPQTFCLVGTEITTDEIDEFEKRFNKKDRKNVEAEYDYIDENKIKVTYEINLKNKSGNRFIIPRTLKAHLYGDFSIKNSVDKITINKRIINGIVFDKFKDLLIIKDKIDFIFDLIKKEVVIEKSSIY